MTPFFTFIIIYTLGFFVTLILLHKYHKELGVDYNKPKTNENIDDWNSNVIAFPSISLFWFYFWVVMLYKFIIKNGIKLSSYIEKYFNQINHLKQKIKSLKRDNEVHVTLIQQLAEEVYSLRKELNDKQKEIDGK